MPRRADREWDVQIQPRKDAKWVAIGGGFWLVDHFDATLEERVDAVPMEPYSLEAFVSGDLYRRAAAATDAKRTMPKAVLEVVVRHGRLECRGVRLEPYGDNSISSTDCAIRLDSMLREVKRQTAAKQEGDTFAFVASGEAVNTNLLAELERETPRRPLRERRSDDFYKEVAEVYRKAIAERRPPRRAVADHNPYYTEAAAKRWIAEARKRGFLGPTVPGKKGEGVAQSA